MNQKQTEINSLEYLAIKYYETDITEEEIRRENITELLQKELETIIQKKEIINMTILGKVIKGKSTVMIKLVKQINELLGHEMNLNLICADQYEFGRKTIENYTNICFGVDEFSALEQTGWNATIEDKYLEQFSDVQAQRGISRISCSPRIIQDRNSDIILEIIEKDVPNKTTRCLVYFKRTTALGERTQLIGHTDIYVGDILEKEWYKRYRTRKFQKMNLITKEGIFQMRQLTFAPVVLQAYAALEPLCTILKPNKDMVEGKIKRELQEKRIPITSLAIEHIKSEVNSLITQRSGISQLKRALKSKKIQDEDKKIIQENMKIAITELNKDINRYKHLIKINEEYEAI